MGAFSFGHWLLVLVIILLVFGTKRLKTIGRDLGEGIAGFREGLKNDVKKIEK